MVMSPVYSSSPALDNVLAHLKGVRTSLRGWKACCPAHADREPSLSIGLGEQGQVLLKCFAGCPIERITEAMGLTLADLFPDGMSASERASSNGAHHAPLTLLDLALEKQLPWQFLFNLGVMERPSGGLHIPYHLADGSPAPRSRIRTALIAREGSRWSKGKGKIVPYGLERLEEARKAGELVLVEGESDCWTLWYQGFPALGLPGAEMVGVLEESALAGIDRLFIIQEPEAAGATFVKTLANRLKGWQWPGKAAVVRLAGAKDPSELYQQDRKGFRAAFQHALEHAEPLMFQRPHPVSSPAETKPRVFSLKALLSWELPPVRWAIPEILPEGLTLLAGKPKLGKSWLALSAALSIASGGVALGMHPVSQGDVLYLALEDNARRLQARTRQLLASMGSVPGGIDFALDWPRLGEGGLASLEDYIKEHPRVRLVVIDTWARVAPPSGERRSSQYEGDYEALVPLKRLADTYRISILAVHHLRKTGSSDVLDEITGSIGMTGAVDGTLILKRERGQAEATLFVTGRDIEREQQLALSFDASMALWSVIGNADEVGLTRTRQEILDLLREQPEGMSPREIAEALEKNYHTTRSILRKMEGTGEVERLNGRYQALSTEWSQEHLQQSLQRRDQIKQREHHHLTGHAIPGGDDYDGSSQSDDADYTDYADYGNDTCAESFTKEQSLHEATALQEGMQSIPLCTHEVLLQEERHQQEPAVISVINRNQCHQRNQLPSSEPPIDVQGVLPYETDQAAGTEPNEASSQRNRCPHHPRTRMVRFDPAGQAWCDRLDCWDCYRLMKIGEALDYRCLKERGGKLLIEEGMEAWAAYVLTQRAFLVTWATQEALALCRVLGIQVPELSGEVKRLVEVKSLPP
jgi:DNA-binding MarR family transcriptional regulator